MNQPVSLEQLARLYQARNEANGRMSAALRSKDPELIRLAKQDSANWNKAYDAARKQLKRQQKSRAQGSMAQDHDQFLFGRQR